MSKKKRMFDIAMPDDEPTVDDQQNTSFDGTSRSRSPMASAIAENASALSERAQAEAQIRAENDALAHEFVALKRAGLVIAQIPLDHIVCEVLVRDRIAGPDPELDELVTSIHDIGLSNPIRVEEREDGKFELIQGYRRLAAYNELKLRYGQTWEKIPACILPRGEGVAGLYRRMVDENLIRKDLSFAEMALTAQAYAADPDTNPTNVDEAVAELFHSANYQRRSYIRSFARLMDRLGGVVNFPENISRNLGLAVLKLIETEPRALEKIKTELGKDEDRTASDEIAILRAALDVKTAQPVAKKSDKMGQGAERQPRTTFEVGQGGNKVRCVAGVGQLILKMDRDFTSIDRQKLIIGISGLLESLDV